MTHITPPARLSPPPSPGDPSTTVCFSRFPKQLRSCVSRAHRYIGSSNRRAPTGCVPATRSGRPRQQVTSLCCSRCKANSAHVPFQDLTRRYIDDLIVTLRAGELVAPGGKARKAWSARSCNYMLGALSQVLG